ncbi:hypothetical protein NCC49_003511 [Naganishia albida]|nr:hypothetical protein NCC49_003511 [Naganishia albida]
MFVQPDKAVSRYVQNEIIRRLAGRVMKAFSPELESTPIHAQDATSDCHGEPDKAAHSDHGIITLAAIEMVLEEAMHPVLEDCLPSSESCRISFSQVGNVRTSP